MRWPVLLIILIGCVPVEENSTVIDQGSSVVPDIPDPAGNTTTSPDGCSEHRYSTCPDGCVKRCVSSSTRTSDGRLIGTSDCEGIGSCASS